MFIGGSLGMIAGRVPTTLYDAITAAGLTSNLKLCLDAGDSASYDGTSQTWTDRSGNGHNFDRGANSGSEAIDPDFNGTAGGKSKNEFFSSSAATGGYLLGPYDHFSITSGTNPQWALDMHKNNAIFTVLLGFKRGSGSGILMSFLTNANDTNSLGWHVSLGDEGTIALFVTGAPGTVLSKTSAATLSTSVGHIAAVSINEPVGAGGGFFWGDGSYLQVSGADTFDSTYSSPSAAETYTGIDGSSFPRILKLGNYFLTYTSGKSYTMPNGSAFNFAAIWFGTALTKAQLDSIYEQISDRTMA